MVKCSPGDPRGVVQTVFLAIPGVLVGKKEARTVIQAWRLSDHLIIFVTKRCESASSHNFAPRSPEVRRSLSEEAID